MVFRPDSEHHVMALGKFLLVGVHVTLGLFAMASGLGLSVRLLTHEAPGHWTRLFFLTAFVTGVVDFAFPLHGIWLERPIGIGIQFFLVLTLMAYFSAHLHGHWRAAYRFGAVSSTYLLFVLGLDQLLERFPASMAWLHAADMRPVAQSALFVLFAWLTFACIRAPHGHTSQRRFIRRRPANLP